MIRQGRGEIPGLLFRRRSKVIKYILFWMAKPVGEIAFYALLFVVLIVLAKFFDWLDRKL